MLCGKSLCIWNSICCLCGSVTDDMNTLQSVPSYRRYDAAVGEIMVFLVTGVYPIQTVTSTVILHNFPLINPLQPQGGSLLAGKTGSPSQNTTFGDGARCGDQNLGDVLHDNGAYIVAESLPVRWLPPWQEEMSNVYLC